MKIFIRDRLNDVEGTVAKAFQNSGLVDLGADNVADVYRDASCDPDDEPEAAKFPNSVIFLHHNENLAVWFLNIDSFLGHIIVISRPGNVVIPNEYAHERIHPCAWRPGDFGDPYRPERLARFIEQLKTGGELDWTLLQPENFEAILAARLIDAASNKDIDTSGLTVHPPCADLAAAAKAVVGAKANSPDLTTTIKTFLAQLGVK
jgi:hypothetical protein